MNATSTLGVGLIGEKVGMTHVYDERGHFVPVTVVKAGPCLVTQVKTTDRDGYRAVQLGYRECRAERISEPEAGHLKNAAPVRVLREFRVGDDVQVAVGDRLTVEQFKQGQLVSVTGVSKGKGFAGVMKRHGFRGGPRTHGQSDRMRAPGSIGSGTTPGRVFKGMKMAGRMGGDRVTIGRLKVVRLDQERGLLLLSGGLPGSRGGLLLLRPASS